MDSVLAPNPATPGSILGVAEIYCLEQWTEAW